LLVERDAADADAELSHGLFGLWQLAPRRLDEPAGLGLLAGEELPELLERGDVVTGPLAEPPARLLEVASLHVAEPARDGLARPVAGDRVTLQHGVVAPRHRHHALLDVALAELDHHRDALPDPLPAFLGRLPVPRVDRRANRLLQPR